MELVFGLDLLGTKDQMDRFLDIARNKAPFLWADNLAASDAGGGGVLQTTIDMTSFYVPGSVDLGPADTPLEAISEPEKKLLDRLAQLSRPVFIGEGAEFAPAEGKVNPFE